MSISELKNDIKNNEIRNLYIFYGDEEFLKKYYLDSIQTKLLTPDMKAFNLIVLDGKVEVKNIVEASETVPMFSEKKLVVVKNSELLKPKKGGEDKSKSKGKKDDLASYLLNIPDYTCVIFYEAEIDKRMKAVDVVKKNGLVVEFPYQKGNDLNKWVINVLKSNKKIIDPETAAKLVEFSEQGMNEIMNEIKKLVQYLGDREKVTFTDIEKVCTKSIKSRIFDLMDAVSSKEGDKALALLNDMISLKEPVQKILFMLTKHIGQVLHMKTLKDEGYSSEKAASIMGIMPFVSGKLMKQASKFTKEELQDILEESLEMDVSIKIGKIDDRVALDILIARTVGL